MSLELLKANITKEKEIIAELSMFSNKLENMKQAGQVPRTDLSLLGDSINSLAKQLGVVNDAIPGLINNIKFYPELNKSDSASKPKVSRDLAEVSYEHPKKGKEVKLGIRKKDKLKFLENETKAKSVARKLEKKELKVKGLGKDSKLTSWFIRQSNKYYRPTAEKLVEQKYFESLNKDLRGITSPFLLHTYIAMMFFATTLAFFLAIILAIPLMIFAKAYLFGILLIFLAPLAMFLLFYVYPSSEKKSLEKEINQELPFVTIYMAAVATSGIEPSKIFEILVKTKDYPFTQREIKKLLNYINFYGYDAVSALKQSAKTCPSERLSMLLNGLGTTIRSGGSLTDFLHKHAETLLFDYRLEREKYTKVAETFMDIYISIVIAAPMIMMILFVLISLTGYGSAYLTPAVLSFLIISIVSALNIGFLLFLNVKQPKF